jgi:hypothetical protein
MKDNRRFALVLALLVAVVLMAGSLFSMQRAQPAAAAIPTPVAEVAGGGDWVMVTYSFSGDFTNVYDTATGGSIHDPAYTAADVSWTLDVSGTITVTCKLQFSNDNSNWADGVNLFADATSDVTNIDQFNLFGRYSRVMCTETGGEAGVTYTATIKAKLMN